MASVPPRGEDPPVRFGKRKRRKRAAGRRSSRRRPAGSSETVSTARGIAALMAEAGLGRRQRTAGRAAVWET